jgi:hypothetical protein
MVTTSYSIDIDVPVARLFAYTNDPSKMPEWSNVLGCEGEPGMPAGSIVTVETQFLGRRSVFKVEMIENDGRSLTKARTIRGPVKFETMHQFEELRPKSSRLKTTVKIEVGTVYKLAEPALESITHTIIEGDSKMLKAILENGLAN